MSNNNIPKYSQPYWKSSTDYYSFPKCTSDINVDVAIIGG